MFTTLFSLSLFAALIQSVLAQSGLTISTPTLVQCQPAQINWTDSGYPPYDVLVVSAQDVCGAAIEDLGNQTSTSMTWTVNLASGTQVVLSLVDAVLNEAWSETITVGDSNDTSCLTSTPTSTPPVTGSVPPTGTTASSSPTTSAYVPVAAAGASVAPASGAPSTRPLSAVTLLSSVVLAVVAFTL